MTLVLVSTSSFKKCSGTHVVVAKKVVVVVVVVLSVVLGLLTMLLMFVILMEEEVVVVKVAVEEKGDELPELVIAIGSIIVVEIRVVVLLSFGELTVTSDMNSSSESWKGIYKNFWKKGNEETFRKGNRDCSTKTNCG